MVQYRMPDRARHAVRRALNAVHIAAPDHEAEIQELRRRLRRSRGRAKARANEAAEAKNEIARTRASLRDPFPWLPLDAKVEAVVADVRAEHLTYLSAQNLRTLARIAVEADLHERPGLFIEAGTARGGSAIVMAAAKAAGRNLKVYDVFGMIPPPTDKDGDDVHRRYRKIVDGKSQGVGGETYYGYRSDLLDEVTNSFARHGVPVETNHVELLQGLFQDTIDLDEPVAFAHIDGDWYESTMTCLERIAPLLVPGGRLVIDDYYAWSGCRTAIDEYFADRPGFELERRAKLHVVRV